MSEKENSHSDDPRLTAYALGELPEQERTEVEALLESSPAARAAVDEMRQLGGMLRKAKLAEPAGSGSNQLRSAVVAKLDAATPVPARNSAQTPPAGRDRSNLFGLAIAAALLVALCAGIWAIQRFGTTLVGQPVAQSDKLSDEADEKIPDESSAEEAARTGESHDDSGLGFANKRLGGLDSRTESGQSAAVRSGRTYDSAASDKKSDGYRHEFENNTAAIGDENGEGRAPGGESYDRTTAITDGVPAQETPDSTSTPRPEPVGDGTAGRDSVLGPGFEPPTDPRGHRTPAASPAEPTNQVGGRGRDQGGNQAQGERQGGAPTGPDLPLDEAGSPHTQPPSGNVGHKEDLGTGGFGGGGALREGEPGRDENQNTESPLDGDDVDLEISGRPGSRPSEDDESTEETEPGDADKIHSDKESEKGLESKNRETSKKPGKDPSKPATTWRRARKVPNTSRLMVGEREELPLEGMQVNVQVDGFRARVLLDLYFLNNHNRQLEGNFQLRLPNEASLYFFAFGETSYGPKAGQRPSVRQAFFNVAGDRKSGTAPDEIMDARDGTWKEPKQARMVTRTKAAHAYRETVRRRVDPALVEWAGAGIFSAKVFPLAPQKLHRIVIGYDVNLLQLGRDLVYRLDLPENLGQCTVDINMAAEPGGSARITPEVKPFTAAGRAYFHFDQPESREFEVRLLDDGDTLIHGEDPDTGPYFAASFQPTLPAGDALSGASQAVFLVDTSLSSNPEKFNVWLSLLRATLNNNRDTIKQFAVLFFNIEQHWWQERYVENTPENIDALIAHCNTLALEGATDLGQALATAVAPKWKAAKLDSATERDYFLLSDGAITWGERDVNSMIRAMEIEGSIFAYRTGLSGTAVQTLAHLARETGGAVFTVVGDDQVEAASTAYRQRPWQLLNVKLEGGSDLMLAGRPRTLFEGQQLLLAGRGTPADDAQVALKVKRGNKVKTIKVPLARRVFSDLAARVYGHVATMGLEEIGDATEDVSTAYARHFRITGRTCSLLMLESEADYKRFNIKPEDDAFVVKSTAADSVIANMLDQLAEKLGDPKAAFTAWLARLEKTPGLSFRISPALRVAVEGMPTEAFQVRPEPLACNERTWETIPEALREQLSVRSFGYEEIMREAQRRRTRAGADDALRALSSLVEYRPGDLVLARDVGYSALDWGLGDQAYHLLRRVAEARPYEPQTYLAIAHCLAGMKKADLAMMYYEVALATDWSNRFQDFRQIARVDYLHFLRQVEKGDLKPHQTDFAAARLDSLTREVDMKACDLLVTIMWNTDGTDVDMHVLEPSGEECYYQHRTTRSGGHITRDVTQGYGPEMYTLRNAPAGEYKVRAKYFASDQNRLSTRTRVIATIIENWGTDDERLTRRTITLDGGKQMTDIATVKVAPGK